MVEEAEKEREGEAWQDEVGAGAFREDCQLFTYPFAAFAGSMEGCILLLYTFVVCKHPCLLWIIEIIHRLNFPYFSVAHTSSHPSSLIKVCHKKYCHCSISMDLLVYSA